MLLVSASSTHICSSLEQGNVENVPKLGDSRRGIGYVTSEEGFSFSEPRSWMGPGGGWGDPAV